MAVVHDVGHSEEGLNAVGRMVDDRGAGSGAERIILLTVTAVAAVQAALLAWLIR